MRQSVASNRQFWWGDFKAADFAAIDPDATIAVLALAATEQHGPHLPLSTDAEIMRGMLAEVARQVPDSLDLRVLPIQDVGKSNEHVNVPGTLSLDPVIALEAWTQIGDSIARTGIRKLVVVTSHGGNEEVMALLTREMRVRHRMLAVKSSWRRFGYPAGMFTEEEQRYGVHGGDIETSLMLHFRPELVDMSRAEHFCSNVEAAEKKFDLLRQTGPFGFAWMATDLNPAGVVGNAAAATAEKGRQAAEHQAHGFVRLLADIRKAKLEELLPRYPA
ncbi:creatininase family protein [Mesorhizobium denitrificans]|uniref:Creatininase family protein n=1 Tax=Mesorhizobium denitrificans TaxID=2294114 RepID=A0A371XGF9_9HYPH|nr:creatininase family protein [Mesorhizobium denitrificans]RFC68311.1 creatininase family protein [Mesorhizobium denitrificans]